MTSSVAADDAVGEDAIVGHKEEDNNIYVRNVFSEGLSSSRSQGGQFANSCEFAN